MPRDFDGGLLYYEFHDKQGGMLKVSYYQLQDPSLLTQDDLLEISINAFSMGQNSLPLAFQIFKINEKIFGISLYKELSSPKNEISSLALVWISSKVINPFNILLALKAVMDAISELNLVLDTPTTTQIVENIKKNAGLIDCFIEQNSKTIPLKSYAIPDGSLVEITQFLL